jgi:hypothetical protein
MTPSDGTLTYEWLRDGVVISGATGKTYKLVAADKGKSISVQVTISKSPYVATTATSSGVVIA